MKKIKFQTLLFFILGAAFLSFSIVDSNAVYFYVSLANFAIFWFLYIHYLSEKIIRVKKSDSGTKGKAGRKA